MPGQAHASRPLHCFSLQIWNIQFSSPNTDTLVKINGKWIKGSIQNQEAIQFHMANNSVNFQRCSQEVKSALCTLQQQRPCGLSSRFLHTPSHLPPVFSSSCLLYSFHTSFRRLIKQCVTRPPWLGGPSLPGGPVTYETVLFLLLFSIISQDCVCFVHW